MKIEGSIAIVTGGGSGIGAALCHALVRAGAGGVVVADIDLEKAEAIASGLGERAVAAQADVSRREAVEGLASLALSRFGRIDLFASNAGISSGAGVDAPLDVWQKSWDLNVMAHVHAAHAAIPAMLEQGKGYFLQTLSAAALVTAPHQAPYATTKTAALGFAQWLAVTYRDFGIGVSCLCPQAVRTPMYEAAMGNAEQQLLADGAMEADDVAAVALDGVRNERFLILPHPEVARFFKRRWDDIDGWTAKMAQYQALAGDPPWPISK